MPLFSLIFIFLFDFVLFSLTLASVFTLSCYSCFRSVSVFLFCLLLVVHYCLVIGASVFFSLHACSPFLSVPLFSFSSVCLCLFDPDLLDLFSLLNIFYLCGEFVDFNHCPLCYHYCLCLGWYMGHIFR